MEKRQRRRSGRVTLVFRVFLEFSVSASLACDNEFSLFTLTLVAAALASTETLTLTLTALPTPSENRAQTNQMENIRLSSEFLVVFLSGRKNCRGSSSKNNTASTGLQTAGKLILKSLASCHDDQVQT